MPFKLLWKSSLGEPRAGNLEVAAASWDILARFFGLLRAETFDHEVSFRRDDTELELATDCADVLPQRTQQKIRLLLRITNPEGC